MAAVSAESISAYLKVTFHTAHKDLSIGKKPGAFWGRVKKRADFEGEYNKISLQYGDIKGVSRTFATAQANMGGTEDEAFKVYVANLADDFGLFSLDGKAMKAARSDRGSWKRPMAKQVRSGFKVLGRRNGFGLYRDTSGAIATVASIATDVVTVASEVELVMLQKGLPVSVYTSGNVWRHDTTIAKVSRSELTFTLTDEGATAATDKIYIQGDYGKNFTGLDSWIPSTAPTAGDSFYGVDRSDDPDLLAGYRHDGSISPIAETMINAMSTLGQFGAESDRELFVGQEVHRRFEKQYEGQIQYVTKPFQTTHGKSMVPEHMSVGIKSLAFQTGNGRVVVHQDMYAPKGVGYLLDMDSWWFHSMGTAPGWLDDDGKGSVLRVHNANAVEGRLGQYAQLCCDAPGYNMRIAFE